MNNWTSARSQRSHSIVHIRSIGFIIIVRTRSRSKLSRTLSYLRGPFNCKHYEKPSQVLLNKKLFLTEVRESPRSTSRSSWRFSCPMLGALEIPVSAPSKTSYGEISTNQSSQSHSIRLETSFVQFDSLMLFYMRTIWSALLHDPSCPLFRGRFVKDQRDLFTQFSCWSVSVIVTITPMSVV